MPVPTRTREQVTAIFLEELGKLTSFIPGGANGSATPEEVADPTRAVQLWTDKLMGVGADTMNETVLRSGIKSMIAKDVQEYQWAVNYPPKSPQGGSASLPAHSLTVTITGTADLPSQ